MESDLIQYKNEEAENTRIMRERNFIEIQIIHKIWIFVD